jgi:hypothetical protein
VHTESAWHEPHQTSPCAQQWPPAQTPLHVCPHPPQLLGSMLVSTHAFPHFVVPPKHWT